MIYNTTLSIIPLTLKKKKIGFLQEYVTLARVMGSCLALEMSKETTSIAVTHAPTMHRGLYTYLV